MDLLSSDTSTLCYRTGNLYFEGQTSLRIQGDGTASVSFVRNSEVQCFAGQLSPERLQQIRSQLILNDPRNLVFSKKEPTAGEASIQIEISGQDQNWLATFRDQDRWSQPALQKAIELFEGVAREISHGVILF